MKKAYWWIIGIVVVIIIIGMVLVITNQGCAKEGKTSFSDVTGKTKECCTGLDSISACSPNPDDPTCEGYSEIVGCGSICSDCGNNICEDWENRCNCPEDCS
jgi:hypothetical protein